EMSSGVGGGREAGLLGLGVASGCRRSDLGGLDWLSRGSGQGIFELGEEGATIRFSRSKTSQAEPAEVHIKPGIALAAVKRWAGAAGITAGPPLFRALGQGGRLAAPRPAGHSISPLVQAPRAGAGPDPAGFRRAPPRGGGGAG